jgi:hypothetical protein
MKIKAFLLAWVLLSSLSGLSQKFSGGVVAGIAGTQVKGDGLSGPDKAGVCFGPFINYKLSDRSALQLQLEFFQKGSRKNPDSLNLYSYLLRLNYIQIPVMYQYRFNKKFGAETGLSYATLISEDEEEYGYTFASEDKPFKNRDISFHLGMHWYISDNLTAEFEFSHSLLYIRKHGSGQTYLFNQGQYNHTLLLAIQYKINSLFAH